MSWSLAGVCCLSKSPSIVLHHYFHVHRAAVQRVVVAYVVTAVAGAGRVVVVLMVHYVVVIVQEHHLFMLVLSLVVPATVGHALIHIVALIVAIAVIGQLFQLICVRRSNELTIHVKYLTLRVHQELSFISFDLNASHDDVVLHVDADLLISLPRLTVGLSRLTVESVVDIYLVLVERALRIVVVLVLLNAVTLIVHVLLIILKAIIGPLILLVTPIEVIVHGLIITLVILLGVFHIGRYQVVATVIVTVLDHLIVHDWTRAVNGHPIVNSILVSIVH